VDEYYGVQTDETSGRQEPQIFADVADRHG